MSQLDLFAARSAPAPAKLAEEWHSPTGRLWVVTDVAGEQMTMQHTDEEDGYAQKMTRSEAAWRRDGWRPVSGRVVRRHIGDLEKIE